MTLKKVFPRALRLRLGIRLALFTSLLTLTGASAQAFYETGESAEITRPGVYKIGVMPQIRLSDGSGMNVSGFFDSGIDEDKSVRVHLGAGETDFYTGGSFKWVPIPDYQNQPAIGGKAEVIYGRKSSDSVMSLRAQPIISKKFETDHGLLTPYGAIPLSVTTWRSNTDTQVNLVAGSEWSSPSLKNMEFGGELGINISKSFSYIAGYVTFLLDEKTGFKKR
jgi:hypothetical protein